MTKIEFRALVEGYVRQSRLKMIESLRRSMRTNHLHAARERNGFWISEWALQALQKQNVAGR